jgi:type 1 glutamine amidotransferase
MFASLLRLSTTALSLVCLSSFAHAEVKPLKVLLIIGGCCHEYDKQQLILKDGIEARVNCEVEVEYSKNGTTNPEFARYADPNWAKAFDVVIHDECAADIKDATTIDNIVNAHANGTPAVNLHCAMHSYRSGNFKAPMAPDAPEAKWFNLLGLQSSSHGPLKPIEVSYTDAQHPITKGLANWTTIKEELYNNVHGTTGNFATWPTAKALATGKQDAGDKDGINLAVVAWTNEFGKNKTRIFSTTLGHQSDTVADPRFLDLVSRGLLWSVSKLDENGKPLPGYESTRLK